MKMALMTPEQFEESLKSVKPRVFMNGKRVENILENRNTRTVVEANNKMTNAPIKKYCVLFISFSFCLESVEMVCTCHAG